jgi:hypothetical protein
MIMLVQNVALSLGYLVANRNRWDYDIAIAFVTPTKPTYAIAITRYSNRFNG